MINWTVLATATVETLYLVAVPLVIGGLVGLVVGGALYTTRQGGIFQSRIVYFVLNFLVSIVRPIPFIIFLALLGPLTLSVIGTTIGNPPVIFALSIAATFSTARIVEQNLVTIDPGVIEAARAMGASPVRIATTLLVPEALGPLILGYTFMFVLIIDASAVAGYVGGGGLGNYAIVYGYQRYNYTVTLVAVAIMVIIVQLAQLLGNWLARRALRR